MVCHGPYPVLFWSCVGQTDSLTLVCQYSDLLVQLHLKWLLVCPERHDACQSQLNHKSQWLEPLLKSLTAATFLTQVVQSLCVIIGPVKWYIHCFITWLAVDHWDNMFCQTVLLTNKTYVNFILRYKVIIGGKTIMFNECFFISLSSLMQVQSSGKYTQVK